MAFIGLIIFTVHKQYYQGFSIMALNDALQKSLYEVPDGVAAGYVDLRTGSLLGIYCVEEKPQEILNIIVTAVAELFEAPLFKIFDNIWSPKLSKEAFDQEAFSEILLLGSEYITLLKRCNQKPQHVVVYVARKTTPPGIVLMQVRNNLPSVESAVDLVPVS